MAAANMDVTMEDDPHNGILTEVAQHIVLPPQLPQVAHTSDRDTRISTSFCTLLADAASAYATTLPAEQRDHWRNMARTIDSFRTSVAVQFDADAVGSKIKDMIAGDTLMFYLRAQNVALIIRKSALHTSYEAFEAQVPAEEVYCDTGKFVRAFPGPVVQVPEHIASDHSFISNISRFLAEMNTHHPYADRREDTPNPSYFVQLFFGIVRGFGVDSDSPRIKKRIADEVLKSSDAEIPWRRSPIWLMLRVLLHTSSSGRYDYKVFMVYFHASFLKHCVDCGLESHLIHTIRTKMARRLYKIRAQDPSAPALAMAQEAAEAAEALLQDRWNEVQDEQKKTALWDPDSLRMKQDCKLLLRNSRKSLQSALRPSLATMAAEPFHPLDPPRIRPDDFDRFAAGGLNDAFNSSGWVALVDFETSVEAHLGHWTTAHLNDPHSRTQACTQLMACMNDYKAAFMAQYKLDPLNQSIAILTLVHLWVAIDRLAVSIIPMISEYPPEIPVGFLEPLLLRTRLAVARAVSLTAYIKRRHEDAYMRGSTMFPKTPMQGSFAVRYYDASQQHQNLRARIEAETQQKLQQKREELQRLDTEWRRLQRLRDLHPEHQFEERRRRRRGGQYTETIHSPNCRRCGFERQMASIRIEVLENPLPTEELATKVVVFELLCPTSYALWRTATYLVVSDLGLPDRARDKAQAPARTLLSAYVGLHGKGVFNTASRISFAAKVGQSRTSSLGLPTTEDQIFKSNGLEYELYDSKYGKWATGPFQGITIKRYGTLKLNDPNSPYAYLQYAIDHTSHTSNQIIADQSECPTTLSLHEHMAFGTLRAGPRLQWMNILREIASNNLTFRNDDTFTLFAQAAWQVGQIRHACDWHVDLEEEHFGSQLVSTCMRMLNSLAMNWLEAVSAQTLVMLVSRLLVAAVSDDVAEAAYVFLRRAREVTLRWLREMKTTFSRAATSDKSIEQQNSLCAMASLVRQTYDVDPDRLDSLLSSSEDAAVLLETAITLRESWPTSVTEAPRSLQLLLSRDQQLSHKLEDKLRDLISNDWHILHAALHNVWPGYHPGEDGETWPDSSWILTRTAPSANRLLQDVYYNLLDGVLLVDGKPLGRLPHEIIVHPTYLRTFGQRILDVIPSDAANMDYATRMPIDGHQMLFALRGSALHIQARIDGRCYELIPHEVFVGTTDANQAVKADLPAFQVEDYAHWLDLETRVVHVRLLGDQWNEQATHWQIHLADRPSLQPAYMYKMDGPTVSSTALVDSSSDTFEMVSQQLEALESAEYLVMTYTDGVDPETRILSVELPRYRLKFTLTDGMLESTNLRSYVVDEDQSAGCFFGLKNQLVLRAKDDLGRSLPRSRTVLVPHGIIKASPHRHHVRITVDLKGQRRVKWYKFDVDQDLGSLNTAAGLESRLYKIYLHALTSFCLPDPLSSQTGTETALEELASGAVQSFQNMGKSDADILGQIGALTPHRERPAKKHHVSVHWVKTLSPLAQHDAFAPAALRIAQYAGSLQVFQTEPTFKMENYVQKLRRHSPIYTRATARNSVHYPQDIIFLPPNRDDATLPDYNCVCRDLDIGPRSEAARWASCLVQTENERLEFDLLNRVLRAGYISGATNILPLGYHYRWLKMDDIADVWLNLYESFRRGQDDHWGLTFSLATLAYGSDTLRDIIPVLLAVCKNMDCRTLSPPASPVFRVSDGYAVYRPRIERIVTESRRALEHTPAAALPRLENESQDDHHERRRLLYENQTHAHTAAFVNHLVTTDRTRNAFTAPGVGYGAWFDVESCIEAADAYYRNVQLNASLRRHLSSVQAALRSRLPDAAMLPLLRLETFPPAPAPVQVLEADHDKASSTVALAELLDRTVPPDIRIGHQPIQHHIQVITREGQMTETAQLRGLLQELGADVQPIRRLYGQDLEQSRADLEHLPLSSIPIDLPDLTTVEEYRDHCLHRWNGEARVVHHTLLPSDNLPERVLRSAGLWPRITSRLLLARLSFAYREHTPLAWKNSVVALGQLFAAYQSSQRLLRFASKGKVEDFFEEYQNPEHEVDDADHLLLEIDGDYRTRPIQQRVAREMIAPIGRNVVLQLNMGAGKTNVIVPMIASSVANGQVLTRVVCLKSLSKQLFEHLVVRLGRLLGRRVLYLPFSRGVQIDDTSVSLIEHLFKDAAKDGAILVTQPEHILSLKLMSVERLTSATTAAELALARRLVNIQNWLTEASRDILDESDELLHVSYQLVYTAGSQQVIPAPFRTQLQPLMKSLLQPPDNHPDRWTTTQQIITLMSLHAAALRPSYEDEIDIQEGAHFPIVRLLRVSMPQGQPSGAALALKSRIAEDVLAGKVRSLNLQHITRPGDRDCLTRVLTERDVNPADLGRAEELCRGSWRGVLLVRGLLAYDILSHCLREKRYRVNYGLDSSRSLLAVPYLAKDIPSLRAEFSHIDVAIMLTALSYRYKGLDEEQLLTAFRLLLHEDEPDAEYEHWIKDLHVVPALRQLNGINTKDLVHFREQVLPVFAHNVGVIDFFLSRVVFPKAAREFPFKLTTSGWDLAAEKTNAVTGFSGTNDRRYLLPTSIKQVDPVQQSSTNALVLTYLLRPENNHYRVMGSTTARLSANDFLAVLLEQRPQINVLLDVGAQMLDQHNQALVQHWLSLEPTGIMAGVFFKGDDLSVITRDVRGWHVEPFASSPWSQQLDRCIVYLDDAHTRGTDLKLPRDARAAITLGPKVTKDRLVQGAMRMRQLGKGQSVMFFAPAECDNQIRAASPTPVQGVRVLDIVRWVIQETCEDIRHFVPHWVQQAIDYSARSAALVAFDRTGDVEALRRVWHTPEARSLTTLYGTRTASDLLRVAGNIPVLRGRLQQLGIGTLADPRMDEEQEREVSHEVEREREVQRPPRAKAYDHIYHPDVKFLVDNGHISQGSRYFFPLLAAVPVEDQNIWSTTLFATQDFVRTIAGTGVKHLSEFMRPVHWIISAHHEGTTILVVISPFEANALLPFIRRSETVRLHVYRPRAIQALRSMSDLQFVVIPHRPDEEWPLPSRAVTSQVDLFAGQLYMNSFDEYVELAAFLGVASPESNRLYNRADIPRRGDGFISPELRVPARCSPELRTILQAFEGKSFHASPIRGLKVLIGLRRYGLEYFKTDVGQILAGRQLSKTDFAGRSGSGGPGGGDGGDDDDDDDDHPGGPPDDMDLDVPPPLAGGDDPPGVPVEPGPGPRPPSPPEGQDMLNAPALEIAHAQHVNAAIKEEAADDLLVEERPDNTQPVKQEDEDDEIEIIDRPPAAIKDEDDDDIIMVKDEDDDVAVVVKNEGDLDLDAQITAAEANLARLRRRRETRQVKREEVQQPVSHAGIFQQGEHIDMTDL